MSRHASAEDLAGLDLDALRARKATRVRNHVAICIRCTQLSSQVSAVPTVLASVSYPSMPSTLTSQLDATLASESTRRLADAPATEADRRDLPERRTRRSSGGWQLPGMSIFATRLAAAGALVLIGVGGYEVATHAGGGVSATSTSSAGSATVPSARQVSVGPSVQFGPASGTKTIRTVYSAENFTAAELGTQALAAVQAAKLEGAGGAQSARLSAPTASAGAPSKSSVRNQPGSPASLTSCLDGIVGNQSVRLVEIAKYEGRPATIIVTAATSTSQGQVWVVGSACSASHPDVLAHQTLSGT